MKKRVLSLLLAVALCLGMLPGMALAADSDFVIENGVLIKYNGPGGDVVIPEGVTSAAYAAFDGGKGITSIVFPSTMRTIGWRIVARNYSGLKDVTIPIGVTSIEEQAFLSWEDEGGATVQTGVTVHGAAGSYAESFVNQTGWLYGYTFVADQSWGSEAKDYFDIREDRSGRKILYGYIGPSTQITFPDDIDGISDPYGLQHIKTLHIPGGISDISVRLWMQYSLSSDKYSRNSDTVETITVGDNAGSIVIQSAALKELVIGDNAGKITLETPNLEKLTIGDNPGQVSVTASNLRELTIGGNAGAAGIIKIFDSYNAVRDSSLSQVTISVQTLKTLSIGDNAEPVKVIANALETLTLGQGLKTVNLTSAALEELSLPDSVTNLTLNCPSVKELTLPKSIESTSGIFGRDLEELTYPVGNSMDKSLYFKEFVRRASSATKLETVNNNPSSTWKNHIAANVAIRNSWRDFSIRPQTSKVQNLSNQICAGLTDDYDKAYAISKWVTENLEYDYDYAYMGMKNYSDVPFNPDEVIDSGMAVCAGYARLTQALLNAQNIPCLYVLGWTGEGYHAWNLALVNGEYIWIDNTFGLYCFDSGTAYFSLDHVATGAAVFDNVKGPGSIVTPALDQETLEELNKETGGAFEDLESEGSSTNSDFVIEDGVLVEYTGPGGDVVIPDGVTSIGDRAFSGCTNLTSVTIPGSVTYICDGAFIGCTNLTNLTFEDGLLGIGIEAFLYCNGLTNITIPDSVTWIERSAFSHCDGLIDVTILNGDTKLDEYNPFWDSMNVTVHAPAGGKVEAYCARNNIAFVALGSEPAAPAIPESGTAYTGTQDVWVGDGAVTLHAYILRDEKGDDMNFVKIRDVAAILNGTAAQFEIGWDGSINLEAGKPYTTATGAELTQVFQGDQPYHVGSYPVNVNGAPVSLTTIILTDSGEGEHNYVKLRDLAEALNFNVGWSAETGVTIYPDQPYVKPGAPSM